MVNISLDQFKAMTDFETPGAELASKVSDLIGVLTNNDESNEEPSPDQDDVKEEEDPAENSESFEPKGLLLSKHPVAQVNILKLSANDNFYQLKSIHKFLYGTECKNEDLVYNINKFKGLTWKESDQEKHQAKVDELRLYTVSKLKDMMDTLDISKPPSKRTVKTTETITLNDGTEKVIELKKIQKAIKDDYIEVCLTWMYEPFINTGVRPRPTGKGLGIAGAIK